MSSSEELFSDGVGSSDEIDSSGWPETHVAAREEPTRGITPSTPGRKQPCIKSSMQKELVYCSLYRKGKGKAVCSEGFPCKEEANKVII